MVAIWNDAEGPLRLLIRNAEIGGLDPRRADVRVRDGVIDSIATGLSPESGESLVEASGGALIPGLHDHHIHLLSLAASMHSCRCGPPEVCDADELARALKAAVARASAGAWIRGFGYHESTAGDLDADALSRLVPETPLRIQHRSGALWIVSRAGLDRLGLGEGVPPDAPPGVERDGRGRPTGRFYRCDGWLRDRIDDAAPPDLAATGETLARFGVTGVTDATPSNDASELEWLTRAVRNGALRQRITVMGGMALPDSTTPGIHRGALKLVLDEAATLDLDATARDIREAHAAGRSAAIHCVTRAELVLAVSAFASAGATSGDRIEHASVAPPEIADEIARLGLTVVTQPNFVRERGDAYLKDVDPSDLPWLYRCKGLLDSGVALGGGTDAPFGNPDPWLAMQAAVDRLTSAGRSLSTRESLSPERALALFTSPPELPGAPAREVAAGEAADLCLLDRPWSKARDSLDASQVAATWARGRTTFRRDAVR